MNKRKYARIVLVSILGVCPVIADPVMQSFSPVADASMYSENSDRSDSVGPHLFAGKLDSSQGDAYRRALLRFDLGAIPAGSTIESAELTLFVNRSPFGGPSPVTMSIHPLLTTWDEGSANAGNPGGLGAQAGAGDPTWTFNNYTISSWSNPGGDFGAMSASALVGEAGASAVFSSAQMVADVQQWLDTPSLNYGWLLMGDEDTFQSARRFASSENGIDPGPELQVRYTIPEPEIAGLILLSCLLIGRYHSRNR